MEGSAAPNDASGEQEGTATDVGAPVATNVGSVFDGATPGSGAGRNFQPVQPGNRWVIYYDKNGVELQRKPKGPGKISRSEHKSDCVLHPDAPHTQDGYRAGRRSRATAT